jgi:glycosyltransferase involved in cell wall biosynthesis
MRLRARLARLASPPLRDVRIRSLARAIVPASYRDRARLSFEAAHRQDADRDRALFHDLLADRPAPDGIVGRIALVCGSLAPGGAERQVVNTLQGLTRAGVGDLHLLCARLDSGRDARNDFFLARAATTGAAIRPIRPHLYRTFPRGSLPPAFAAHFAAMHPLLASTAANLYWELKELRPNVVHAWLDWMNLPAGIAAALAGVPRIVLSGRNMEPRRFKGHAPFMAAAYRALCAVPGVSLVNNSRAGAEDYAAWLGLDADEIPVIYNGVESADTTLAAGERERWRQTLNLPPQAGVVGGMFRFSPEKRPLLWLQVAAAVAARKPDTCFVLFGEGELLAEIKRLARQLGLASRLRLPGVTASPFAALSAMDTVLITSSWEGTPNVALEAQSCGVPVVATGGGGSAEAIAHGETGWIVDSSEAPAIAERVAATLDDTAVRHRVRRAGPRFIAERFGLERMIDETLRAYGHRAPSR